MKQKIRKLFKKRVFLCILMVLITGAVSVYAVTYFPSNQVTYDNKTSGLKSSDVQGAIDELYSTCSSAMAAGDYLYYAVNRYGFNLELFPNGYTLYRCNSSGGSCSQIAISSSSIGSIYATNDYLYYAVNHYGSSFGIFPNGYTLYRCNSSGGSCSQITISSNDSIGSIYATNDYLYYAVNGYNSDSEPSGYALYRCSLSGENCQEISTMGGRLSIVI